MNQLEYKHYLLSVLVLVGAISMFDRFVFALALEPIKQDLGLSDTQLGLMTGIAFAAFYAIAGVPIARWADRGNRVTISALSVGLLGIMVSCCGMAANFFQLLIARAGIAIGEAGTIPPAQSLLADYFDRAERPRAMGIYFIYYTISMVIGYLIGGWMIESYGWRTTFIVLGIPGVLVALLVRLTLKEPRLKQPVVLSTEMPGLRSTIVLLWQQNSFRKLFIVFCLSYFFFMGVSQWLATFFIRSHGMSSTELGVWFALIWGLAGLAGNYLGGDFASRYAVHKEKLQMRVIAVVFVFNMVASAMLYLASDRYLALGFMAVTAFLLTFGNGPIFAAIQSLVHERVRSLAIALMFMFGNLIGFGLGPLALGMVSDALQPQFGDDSLRYALLIFAPGGLLVAYLYWLVSNHIEEDLAAGMDIANGEVSRSQHNRDAGDHNHV
ncbi:spinster family MFS transporter [SAR92 clade bacterium H246]